jgi:hypothetical protein
LRYFRGSFLADLENPETNNETDLNTIGLDGAAQAE